MVDSSASVIVVGLGSIGERHVRLLTELGADVTTVSRRPGVGDAMDFATVVAEKPDALLLISTETVDHAKTLKLADDAGHRGPVVIEKPLGLNSAEFSNLQPRRPLWIAYNMRYLPVVRAFKDALDSLDELVLSAHAYAGSFLGDWRPSRQVSETYSAHQSAGGGVLRDLSHELDLIAWIWGKPDRVSALGGRMGDITVDSDDCWNILMRTEGGVPVSLSLNYFDRPTKRFLHAVSSSTTLSADLVAGTLTENGEVRHFPAERDDSYRAMWRDILNAYKQGTEPAACNFQQGFDVLTLIEDCEKSAKDASWGQR